MYSVIKQTHVTTLQLKKQNIVTTPEPLSLPICNQSPQIIPSTSTKK